MNWKEIKEKYPKAWSLLEKNNSYSEHVDMNIRNLFDFFDSNEILILVSNNDKELWFWYIENYKHTLASCEESPNTRVEAEQMAFLKAFEILEKQLK